MYNVCYVLMRKRPTITSQAHVVWVLQPMALIYCVLSYCVCVCVCVCVQGKVAEKRALDRSRSLHARVRYIEMVSHYTHTLARHHLVFKHAQQYGHLALHRVVMYTLLLSRQYA